jgi:hypothetical protein
MVIKKGVCTGLCEPTTFVDSRGRVRARLWPRGQNSVLTFYNTKGAERQSVQGMLGVSQVLFRMLNERKFHPEIVEQAPPLTLPELLTLQALGKRAGP